MSGKELILLAAVAIVFLGLGVIFDRVLTHHRVGSFTINYNDPEKDLCTLNLEKDLDYIDSLRTMELDVKVVGKEYKYGFNSERNTEQHQSGT